MSKSSNRENKKKTQDDELSELIKRKIQENNTIKKLMEYLDIGKEALINDERECYPEEKKKRKSSP
jgi:hypothetical protein